MRTFVERQADELLENGAEIVKATLGLLVGCAINLFLVFRVGFVHYVVGMWLTAVAGGVCLLRSDSRPVGKGLLAAASILLSSLPVFLFGALFRSLG